MNMVAMLKFSVKLLRINTSCDLKTKVSGLKCNQAEFLKILLLVKSHAGS